MKYLVSSQSAGLVWANVEGGGGVSKQEKVFDLEADGQEDVDGESVAEAVAGPVLGAGSVVEFGHQDCGPGPPSALESDDEPEGRPSTGFEGDFCTVYPGLD